jgi:hypothetical protein
MKRWDWPFALAASSVLLLLRGLQLRSTAHRLYDSEWVRFITFSEHLSAGTVVTGSLHDFMLAYQHQNASQGVAAVQISAAFLGAVLGPTMWSLHGVTMLAEALLVLELALLLRCLADRRIAALALAPVLLVPTFVVTWQLLPFGNHTEFFFLPVLLALFLVGRAVHERPLWHWLLPILVVAAGFFLYRVLLAPALSFAAVCLLFSRGRGRVLGPLAVALGLALAVALLATAFPQDTFTPLLGNLSLLAPRMEPSGSSLLAQFSGGWLRALPRAPRGSSLGYLYPIVLLLGPLLLTLLAVVRRKDLREPVLVTFVIGWAAVGLLMPSFSSALRPEYLLTGVYGLLLCWALLVAIPWGTGWPRWLLAGVLALSLFGGLDSSRYVRPGVWEATADYEAVAFWRELGLRWVDTDDVPYFARIVAEGRAHLAMSFGGDKVACHWDTSDAAGRVPGGRISDLREGHCTGWGPGELATQIRAYDVDLKHVLDNKLDPDTLTGLDTGYMHPGGKFDPDAVGRGAWILCNRDLSRLEAALEGLAPEQQEPILAGARAEAQLWSQAR